MMDLLLRTAETKPGGTAHVRMAMAGVEDKHNSTPLSAAAGQGHVKAVKKLMELQVQVEGDQQPIWLSIDQCNPLMEAVLGVRAHIYCERYLCLMAFQDLRHLGMYYLSVVIMSGFVCLHLGIHRGLTGA